MCVDDFQYKHGLPVLCRDRFSSVNYAKYMSVTQVDNTYYRIQTILVLDAKQ